MQNKWVQLKQHFNQRNLRERILICFTGMVIISLVSGNYIIAPLTEELQVITQEITQRQHQYQLMEHQFALLQGKLNVNPGNSQNSELSNWHNLLAQYQKKAQEITTKKIESDHIPLLLNKLLDNFYGLTLLSIQTLPSQEVLPSNGSQKGLYRHEVKIIFSGQYEELLHYLKNIETISYPFGWKALEYKLTQFPQARIILTLYTLSEQPIWFRV